MSLKLKLIGLMVLILGATVLVSYTIFDRSEAELLQQVVQHVKSVENVKAMKALGDEKSFLALIQRGENTLFVVVSAE